MKGKRLLDSNSADLNDDDLDMQVGALAEELEHVNSDITKIDRVRDELLNKRAALEGRAGIARADQDNRRGNGQGNNGRGNS